MRRLIELTETQELDLCERRESGEARKDLIKEFGVSEREYKKIILKHGGVLRSKVQKYNFNENYFENIDTEDKAYFLGFITADGSVNDDYAKFVKIKLKTDDFGILEDYISYTEYEGPVYYHKNGKYCEVSLSGKKVVSDLGKLGILPNKTRTVEFPKIPENLVRHYMRGVFDGDGCISIHKKREGSRDTTDRGQVNLCSASKNFIEEYVDRLHVCCGITKNKIRDPKGTYYVIDWGSFGDIEKFYHFFYSNASVYLKRKKETFDIAVGISKTKIRYRKK
jgi:hypothetical protein